MLGGCAMWGLPMYVRIMLARVLCLRAQYGHVRAIPAHSRMGRRNQTQQTRPPRGSNPRPPA
eukprot:4572686-Pyramimonas_sp.AAC.1